MWLKNLKKTATEVVAVVFLFRKFRSLLNGIILYVSLLITMFCHLSVFSV